MNDQNDEELVDECLRKYDTDGAALNSIRCHGVDESVLQALREFGAGEELDNARIALRDYRHRKYAADEAMEKARCRKAELDSISESPVLKDVKFWENFRAAEEELQKTKEHTKRYIDSGRRSVILKGAMGSPKRNADGSITWELNDEPKPRPANVRADGKIDPTKSIMGNPKRNADGSITWK